MECGGNEITDENHIGYINPLRYRGYYYDAESGLYYLNSRYYDPEVGRFINADEQLNKDVMGCNLYAYCGNNPVTRSDEKGGSWQFSFVCAVIGGVVGFTSKVIANKLTGKKWNEGVVGATVGGIVGGAVFGATYNHTVATSTAAAFAGAFAQSAANEIGKYCSPIGKVNGQSTTQKVTSTNVTTSIVNVGYETVVNGGISMATGSAVEAVIPSISATNDIKSITASLFDDFAKKTHKQTVLQGVFDMEVDMVQNIGESLSAGQIQQSGMIMLYAKE